MTSLTFTSTADCPECGVTWVYVVTGSYRVNKASIRPIGSGGLSLTLPKGTCAHGEPDALLRVRPDEKSAETIRAIRRRRGWDS